MSRRIGVHGRVNLTGAVCLVSGLCAMALPARAGALVYRPNYGSTTIGRANLDGTTPDESFITGASSPRGVAVDAQHVYWDNYITGAIGRSSLDGSAPDRFIAGASFPVGVAVDGQYVYWANSGTGTIGRANLDGNPASVDENFITGASAPEGVAVDAQHVYWDNYSTGTIGRTNLDGTTPNENFIIGADHPEGVAVDAQHVYWANSNAGAIGRANLDGNLASVDQSFITGVSPVGVAVDAQYVYWANAGTGIGRAGLDGTGTPELSFVPLDSGNPSGVAVDSIAGTNSITPRTLTVAKAGSGTGSVTSTEGQVNCGSSCSHSYAAGTVVTLHARAAAGSTFAGWSGAGCSGVGSCTVTMSSDRAATATFKRRPSPPNTRIGKARIDSPRGTASFRFKSSDRSAAFQCALVKKGQKAKFKRCKSPRTYKSLPPGRYTFLVRAVGPGGSDASPAKKEFKVGR